MHDATPAGIAVRTRALAYWQETLSAAVTSQHRSPAFLLTRAAVRALACCMAVLACIASVYVCAVFILAVSTF